MTHGELFSTWDGASRRLRRSVFAQLSADFLRRFSRPSGALRQVHLPGYHPIWCAPCCQRHNLYRRHLIGACRQSLEDLPQSLVTPLWMIAVARLIDPWQCARLALLPTRLWPHPNRPCHYAGPRVPPARIHDAPPYRRLSPTVFLPAPCSPNILAARPRVGVSGFGGSLGSVGLLAHSVLYGHFSQPFMLIRPPFHPFPIRVIPCVRTLRPFGFLRRRLPGKVFPP